MFKKCLLALIIFVITVSLAFAELPFIFQNVKAKALTAKQDDNGNYFLEKKMKAGEIWIIGFIPDKNIVGIMIVQGNRRYVVATDGEEYRAAIFEDGNNVIDERISEEEASNFAEKIYKGFENKGIES